MLPFRISRATGAASRRISPGAALALAGLLALLPVLPGPARAGLGDGTRPHCEVCRRYADYGPSRMEIGFTYGKRKVLRRVCSVFCYYEMMEDYQDKQPDQVRIINYSTLEDELPLWIHADRGHYVLTELGDEEKSSSPFVYAFQNEDQARTASEELDGNVMDWDELTAYITDLTDEYEPERRRFEHTPNKYRPRK